MVPAISKPVVVKVVKAVVIGVGVKLAFLGLAPIRRWKLRKVPGPFYVPFVGDGLQIVELDMPTYLSQCSAKYNTGPVCKFWAGTDLWVIVRDARLGHQLLRDSDVTIEFTLAPWSPKTERTCWDQFMPYLNGAKWSKCRKAMEEIAHATAMTRHAAEVATYINRLAVVFDKYAAENKALNVQGACMAMAHSVIIEAVFGTDMCSFGKELRPESVLSGVAAALAQGTKPDAFLLGPDQIEDGWWDKYPMKSADYTIRLLSSFFNFSSMVYTNVTWAMTMCLGMPQFSPLWRFLVRLFPDKYARQQLRMIRGARQACLQLIRKWKEVHLAGNTSAAPPESRGMIHGILEHVYTQGHGDEYSENEVLGIVFAAMLMGFENVGTALAQSLYQMAKHPEVQKKAQAEVDQVLGGKAPDVAHLKDLHYVSAVINEILRFASPVPVTTRRVVKDYVHPDGSFRIPKNTRIWFPFDQYHVDPSIWPRADEFLPERHIQPGHEDLAPTDPELFMPFGAGARKCPGYKFVFLEHKLALARLLQRFEFSLPDGHVEPALRFNLARTAPAIMLKVSKRKAVA